MYFQLRRLLIASSRGLRVEVEETDAVRWICLTRRCLTRDVRISSCRFRLPFSKVALFDVNVGCWRMPFLMPTFNDVEYILRVPIDKS